jgi:hypothetical protein
MKKPLERVLSVYTNSETAIAVRDLRSIFDAQLTQSLAPFFYCCQGNCATPLTLRAFPEVHRMASSGEAASQANLTPARLRRFLALERFHFSEHSSGAGVIRQDA